MGSLEGKVAIVTGAAGGIGTAVEADNTAGRAPGATHRGPTKRPSAGSTRRAAGATANRALRSSRSRSR